MAEAMKEINQDNTDAALNSLASQCLTVAANVQNIVNELSKKPEDSFISSLHNLKAGRTVYKQKEIQELSDLLSNTGLGAAARDHITPYIMDVEKLISEKRQSILRSLYYEQLREREFAITDAHTKTFQWVFGDNTTFKFREWLREQNGVYWITGKAGSGKSTLMKFIIEQYATSIALRLPVQKASVKLQIRD
ncbi:hypothetical protein INS49_000130 [Diaporthe citri]|uniref:uncharacterized protein n=1 Tax=Diaporthe citri TaxID=83186 RepID=UPI001C7F1159|nr:uncharacterized protein INS49_000130 [Diaporthe citri]KAG6365954.1 hypothetical protein INS49_000130 [Diaporthe citri]